MDWIARPDAWIALATPTASHTTKRAPPPEERRPRRPIRVRDHMAPVTPASPSADTLKCSHIPLTACPGMKQTMAY